jgi:hypothetical protein
MKTKDGKVKPVEMKNKLHEKKVFRLIAMEPAMWDMFDKLAKNKGITRSTFIRCDLKDCRRSKMSGIDWSETNK